MDDRSRDARIDRSKEVEDMLWSCAEVLSGMEVGFNRSGCESDGDDSSNKTTRQACLDMPDDDEVMVWGLDRTSRSPSLPLSLSSPSAIFVPRMHQGPI